MKYYGKIENDKDLITKEYGDWSAGKFTTMPTPTSALEGKICQYVGTTTLTYTNGYFYKCVNNSGTYKWQSQSVSATGDFLPLSGGTMTGPIYKNNWEYLTRTANDGVLCISAGSDGYGGGLILYGGNNSDRGKFRLKAYAGNELWGINTKLGWGNESYDFRWDTSDKSAQTRSSLFGESDFKNANFCSNKVQFTAEESPNGSDSDYFSVKVYRATDNGSPSGNCGYIVAGAKTGIYVCTVDNDVYSDWEKLSTNAIDTAGTGLSKSGTTLNHSNSVTVNTTSGLKFFTYDAQGHITAGTNKTLGRGLSDSSNVIGHSNTAITAQTTQNVQAIKYDAYGHITAGAARPIVSSWSSTTADTNIPSEKLVKTGLDAKIDTAGTGLSKSGTTLNHSNSVTAQTTAKIGTIKYDAQGHITGFTETPIQSSVSSSSTNSQLVGAKLFYDTVGNVVTLIDAL